MKTAHLSITLTCAVALWGCSNVAVPLADADASSPSSAGHSTAARGAQHDAGGGGHGGSPNIAQRDAGSAGSSPLGDLDGGATTSEQLGTRSRGCERVPDVDLCIGEGWMLARGESIPACGESGAYRICTFTDGACVSRTVMMVQRCD